MIRLTQAGMITLLGITLVTLLAACDPGVEVRNVAPSVTAIGPVTQGADGVSIGFWVRDHEQGAIDVQIELLRGANATELPASGGHGTTGLTSSSNSTGMAHVVIWDAEGVGPDEKIRLRITPTDNEGVDGEPLESAEFTLTAGLPAP